jgi:hypothetical protein
MVRCPSHSSVLSDIFPLSSCIINALATNYSSKRSVIYFYFDFKDEQKQSRSGLLSSLVFQLAANSRRCFDILTDTRARVQKMNGTMISKMHAHAYLHPTDEMLFECLESMLHASSEIFIILDALDECPEAKRASDILPLLNRLVSLGITGLHLLVTSRPERDIRRCISPLSSHHLDLSNTHEHKEDLARFISHELLSSEHYEDWPLNVKSQAKEILVEKAKGM